MPNNNQPPQSNPYDSKEGEFMADVNDPIQNNPPPQSPDPSSSTTPPAPTPTSQPPPPPPQQTPPASEPSQSTPPAQQTPPKPPTSTAIEQSSSNDEFGSSTYNPPIKPHHHLLPEIDLKTVGLVIVAIIIIGLIYFYVSHPAVKIITTTIFSNIAINLNSCARITVPGVYNLTSNLSTSNTTGSCIAVLSSNVRLNGKGHTITGNGPFIDTPPYSSAISLSSVSNVVINGVSVSKFSYGVFLNNSNSNLLSNITVQNITITGIYLLGSTNNKLNGDHVSDVNGPGGGVSIQNGGNNTISSTSMKYNAYTGLSINSTGNGIYNDTLIGNPVDLACSGNAGYASYNKFSNTSCYVNHYCNFASCTAQNVPYTPQYVVLQSSINQCGTINYPGSYSLSSSINIPSFLGLISANSSSPCIIINSSNVNLNCNGYSITNGTDAITANNQFNLTVSNCKLSNNTHSIFLSKIIKFNLANITASMNQYGIYIIYSTGANMTNIVATGNKYGIYINGTTYATLSRFNTNNNTFGISMDNSTGVAIGSGTTLLNSKMDLFCAPSIYNSTLSTISQSQCSTTDCVWAGNVCPVHYLPNLSTFPVTSCTVLNVPGQYSLSTNLLGNGNCLTIKANNVSIDCNDHTINGFGQGSAITANNVSYPGIFDCKIAGFANGIHSANTLYMTLKGSAMDNVGTGINVTNSAASLIWNNTVANFSGIGFRLTGVSKSTMLNNTAFYGLSSTTKGFVFSAAINDTIHNNTAFQGDGDGFVFQNNTHSNWIYNNTGFQNRLYDYVCSSGSTGPYTNNGGLNNGLSKLNCKWLVAVPPPNEQISCAIVTSPTAQTFQYDMEYIYGNTCFLITSKNVSVNARNSVINCAGHTVYATNGGTFVKVVNTSMVTIENCILEGFTTPIVVTSKIPQLSIHLINNTIIGSVNAITVTQATYSTINNNNITNAVVGISATVANSTMIENNLVVSVVNGIIVNATNGATIKNNNVSASNSGIKLINVTGSSMQKNILQGLGGLFCSALSAPKNAGNLDLGGNICPSNNCMWITSPAC